MLYLLNDINKYCILNVLLSVVPHLIIFLQTIRTNLLNFKISIMLYKLKQRENFEKL